MSTMRAIVYPTLATLFCLILTTSSCDPEVPPAGISEIITTQVSNVTRTSLTTGGTITALPGTEVTERGVVWSRSPKPELGNLSSSTSNGAGSGSFETTINGLSLVNYHIRAYAIANGTTYYGNEVVFNLSSIIPTITSQNPVETTLTSVTVQSTINYTWTEPIVEKGICWGTVATPTVDIHSKIEVAEPSLTFTVTLSNISQSKVYYARAYAVTQAGIFYGNSVQILILPPPAVGEVADINGKKYKTVVIGNTTWMAENLAVTKYNDGTDIAGLFTVSDFKTTTQGAYTAYEGDNGLVPTYGYLYNGYVIVSTKNVCMTGWRVPESADWFQLASLLGGMETAGGRMMAVSTLWRAPNLQATNQSGFTGLPGGSFCSPCLSNTGTFADLGGDGYWWSKSAVDFFYISANRADMRTRNLAVPNDGLSIRCVKD
jgi:uncharacterized protein (TIGR02145 family)